jgi:hypothetical protein
MRDARSHGRIACRLAVDVFCGNEATRRRCFTRDIGLGGLFVTGGAGLRHGQPVSIELGPSGRTRLHLEARVNRLAADGVGLEFDGNSAATLDVLASLIEPKWDGVNLLDGVLTMSPWYGSDNLAGWMRLTSLVADWRQLKRA